MDNHELKVANTKRLSKTLLTTCFVISTYNLVSTDQLPSKNELTPLTVSAEAFVNGHSENGFTVDQAPIELKMSLSLEIDLGESLNSLIRDFIRLR